MLKNEEKEVICSICKETFWGLHIHHKDGNHKNNSPNNLISICPTCHSRIHQKRKGDIYLFRALYRNKIRELVLRKWNINLELKTLRDFLIKSKNDRKQKRKTKC